MWWLYPVIEIPLGLVQSVGKHCHMVRSSCNMYKKIIRNHPYMYKNIVAQIS